MLRERPAGSNGTAAHAQLLTAPSALEALQAEWERLWSQDARATPFQSPAWLLPWWKHLAAGRLASITLRCAASGELVGLAPLYVPVDPDPGRQRLLPIGIGTTDDLDLLAKPGWEDRLAQAVLSFQEARADRLEFPQLRADAPLLRARPPAGWRCEIGEGEPHPVLPLQSAGALRLGGELAAVLYCLADPPWRPRRRCYYYLGGFDPRFAACSPGSLLIAHAIAQARREGACAFDFLRGAEPSKYRWGAVDQGMHVLRVARA